MASVPPTVNLYATRWKPFLAAIVFAGGIVIDLLFYFVWPTPVITTTPWEYQEPTKTILFIVALLICAVFVLLGLYWTVTPIPMLQLSESRLVYHPFPLPTRTIYWADVALISAFAAKRDTSLFTRATFLTLSFMFKPHDTLAHVDQQSIELDINLGTLSLRAEDLVRLIRNYHEVQFRAEPKHSKTTRQFRRRNQS
ncbi:MAG TPA: hypothetical protein VFS83_06650 [Ktedonobacterales bacterium]|nr:hypothetical protein [Ktedonobacterales bacterium]